MNRKNTHIIGIGVLLVIGLLFITFYLLFPKKDEPEFDPVLTASSTPVTTTATTSVVAVAVSTTTVTTVTTTVTKKVTTPVVTPPVVPAPKPVVIPTPPQPVIVQPTVVSTTTVLVVKPIALLSGGTASAGVSVPVSYLQVINNGSKSTLLSGFWLEQNGSADTDAVIGFVVVDDKGNRVSSGGTESTKPFDDDEAFVSVGVTFAPYEMKLFTIKAIITSDISDFVGQDLKIDVKSIEANNSVKAVFPIRGTTWLINN